MARETTTDPHGFLGGHSTATADYNSWTVRWVIGLKEMLFLSFFFVRKNQVQLGNRRTGWVSFKDFCTSRDLQSQQSAKLVL